MAIVLLAGQSNALGYLNTSPAPYAADPLTYIWDNDHAWWVQMQPGVNTGTPENPADWGPEVAFAQAFRAAHPDEVLAIVKSVKGSTGVAEDPNQLDWSPASHGEMFDLTTARLHAAEAAIGAVAPDQVFFMGMETDATDAGKAGHALENLTDLVAHMRADWGATDIGLGRIGAAGAYSQDVRVAQWSVDQADPHLTSFKTIGFEMQPDGLHYDAAGQLALGQGFFDASVFA